MSDAPTQVSRTCSWQFSAPSPTSERVLAATAPPACPTSPLINLGQVNAQLVAPENRVEPLILTELENTHKSPLFTVFALNLLVDKVGRGRCVSPAPPGAPRSRSRRARSESETRLTAHAGADCDLRECQEWISNGVRIYPFYLCIVIAIAATYRTYLDWAPRADLYRELQQRGGAGASLILRSVEKNFAATGYDSQGGFLARWYWMTDTGLPSTCNFGHYPNACSFYTALPTKMGKAEIAAVDHNIHKFLAKFSRFI